VRSLVHLQQILNVTAVIATLCAVAAVGINLHERWFAADPYRPTHIAKWRSYAQQGARMGATNAKVTIVEFADFQCPYCRRAAGYLDSLLRHDSTNVALVYRHFPIHRLARAAAVASWCAARQGVFRDMQLALYAKAESIGVKPWAEFARDAGVTDTAAFGTCESSAAADAAITRDSIAGSSLGIPGTPTFLINSLKVTGYLGDSVMNNLVSEAKRAK